MPQHTSGWPWRLRALVVSTALLSAAIPTATASATFPGRNGRIVFSSNRDATPDVLTYQLYSVDPDGSGVRRLTHDGGWDFMPAWSPDGTRIAFAHADVNVCGPGCFIAGRYDIYLIDADGSNLRRLTTDPGGAVGPHWTPDGRISYGGGGLTKLMLADGTPAGVLFGDPFARKGGADWSPDGRKIVYSGFANGVNGLFSADTDGSNAIQLTTNSGFSDLSADWSPDETRIVFTRQGPQSQIYLMGADGGNLTRLTTFGSNENAAWSPDGTRIVLSSNDRLVTINPDGTGVSSVLPDGSTQRDPDWQPAAATNDTTPPVITVPSAPIVAEATSSAGATTEWSASASDDTDPVPTLSCDPPSGTTFALGTTTVTCTASDASGNTAHASFDVAVRDTTPPSLAQLENIDLNANSPDGATVSFAVTAHDTVDAAPVIDCSPSSGTTFAIGDTTVACRATDAAGNSARASFAVHVAGAREQIDKLIDRVLEASVPSAPARAAIANALKAAAAATTPRRQCVALAAFQAAVSGLARAHVIDSRLAAELLADATRIRAVLACAAT